MNEDAFTIQAGHLDVGDGHKIYYQEWGNPKGTPIFYLHGGPGSGTKDTYKTYLNPKKHHVIFHDQRGSGKSTPFASTKSNTTQDLINDIEILRNKFGFSKVSILGGSWGSFLGFAYAITHPDRVEKMVLWGIFSGTKKELDYIQQGGLQTHFPDAWQQYIDLVPKKHQDNTTSYYLDKMENGTQAEIEEHVRRWVLLEISAMSLDSDYESALQNVQYDDITRALAILEAHYFNNACFIEDGFVLKNMPKISHIPSVLIHGRFDHVCPPETAFTLAKRYGEKCHFHTVPGAHGREGAMREVIRAYAWSFLD